VSGAIVEGLLRHWVNDVQENDEEENGGGEVKEKRKKKKERDKCINKLLHQLRKCRGIFGNSSSWLSQELGTAFQIL
jgi:hypothetical protein